MTKSGRLLAQRACIALAGIALLAAPPALAKPKATTGESFYICSCFCSYKDSQGGGHSSVVTIATSRTTGSGASPCSEYSGQKSQCTSKYSGSLEDCITKQHVTALAPGGGTTGRIGPSTPIPKPDDNAPAEPGGVSP